MILIEKNRYYIMIEFLNIKLNNRIIRPLKRLYFSIKLSIKPKQNNFKYNLGIVVIVKNEGEYIKEWLDYHKAIGIGKVYLYDNGSTDNTIEVIRPYIETGFVLFTEFSGQAMQIPAYKDACCKYRNECKYMAFIDADEFLVSVEDRPIHEVVDEIISIDPHAAGVAINWRVYGSSGYINKPNGGVLENFLYRANENGTGNYCIKTICNPRLVFEYNHSHYPTYAYNYYSINEIGEKVIGWRHPYNNTLQKLRINHYFCKSQEEWIKRRSIGKADHKSDSESFLRTIDEFKAHDNNDIYDDIMLKYVQRINKH